MDIETFREKPLSVVGPILKLAYKYSGTGPYSTWTYDYVSKRISKGDPEVAKVVEELFNWGRQNPVELEILIAKRSPGTAAKLAVSHKRRLCREAEQYVIKKAGDRATLLEYCGHFGIVLDDLTKVTMKAAFNDDSWREKNYIKKLEGTKRTVKGFLAQMVNIGRIDPQMSVMELIETLESA